MLRGTICPGTPRSRWGPGGPAALTALSPCVGRMSPLAVGATPGAGATIRESCPDRGGIHEPFRSVPAVWPEDARRTMCLLEVRHAPAALGQRRVLLREHHLRMLRRSLPLVRQALGRRGLLQALRSAAQRSCRATERLRPSGTLRGLRRAAWLGTGELLRVRDTREAGGAARLVVAGNAVSLPCRRGLSDG